MADFFTGFAPDPNDDLAQSAAPPPVAPAPVAPTVALPAPPPAPTSGLVRNAARRTAGDLQYAPPAPATPAAPIFDPVAAFAATPAPRPPPAPSIPGLEDTDGSAASLQRMLSGAGGAAVAPAVPPVPALPVAVQPLADGTPVEAAALSPQLSPTPILTDSQGTASSSPQPAAPMAQGQPPTPEGFWTTAGRALASNIAPAIGTAVGGLGAGALAIESGPGAIAADIAGGALAGTATRKLQNAVLGDEASKANDAQMAVNAQAHPIAHQIGTLAPFLISLLGGGGGVVRDAAGKIITGAKGQAVRGITAEGKQVIQDAAAAGTQYLAPTAERIAQAAAGGARAGASEGAQEKYVEGKDVSVLDSAAKGVLTFGATGAFAPAAAHTAVGLFPVAKAILTEAVGRGVKDGAAMTLAGDLYDSAVHGKSFSLEDTAKEMGGSIPTFVVQNALLGFLHHGLPTRAATGDASPAVPPTPVEQLTATDHRLTQIGGSRTGGHEQERETLLAQRAELVKAAGGEAAPATATPPGEAAAAPADPTGLGPEFEMPTPSVEAATAAASKEPVTIPGVLPEPAAVTPTTPPEMKLPRDLAGAKPRYAFGPKQYEVQFESDLDKTAYTLAQDKANKRHADYLRAAQEQTGLSEQQLIQHGQAVRAAIKAMARDGDPTAGPLSVPKQGVKSVESGPPPAPAPAAPAPTSRAEQPPAPEAAAATASDTPEAHTTGDTSTGEASVSPQDQPTTKSDEQNAPTPRERPEAQTATPDATPAPEPEPPRGRVPDGNPPPELASGADNAPAAGNAQPEPAGASGQRGTGDGVTTPPNETHAALAEHVNSGAATDNPDGAPSKAFQVLQRIRQYGGDVTPETARDVSVKVADIHAGPPETQHAALDALVRDHLSPEAAQLPADAVPTLQKAPSNTSDAAPALSVGDKIDLTGNGTVHTLTADTGGENVTLTSPSGRTLSVPRDVALRNRVVPTGDSPPATPPISARGQADQPVSDQKTAREKSPSQADLPPARPSDQSPAPTSQDAAPTSPPDQTPAAPKSQPPATDRIAVTRQPGDTDQRAAAREWIADERQAGRDPKTADVVKKFKVNPTVAGDILDVQDRAEEEAAARAATTPQMRATAVASDARETFAPDDLGEHARPVDWGHVERSLAHDDPSYGQPPPTSSPSIPGIEREPVPAVNKLQPVTFAGREAQRTIEGLTARQQRGETLTPIQQQALDTARLHLDRDLNGQALSTAQPTTAKGRAALRYIEQMEAYRASGKSLKAGDYDNLQAAHRALTADFTAQRQALEVQLDVTDGKLAPSNRPAIDTKGQISDPLSGVSPVGDGGTQPKTGDHDEMQPNVAILASEKNQPSAKEEVESSTHLTTSKNVVGNKINRLRTAFHPESGTLGIPRDQMPQMAAEHRGAMANFLNARGMKVSEADVLPGDLKPSQADFNPGKVAKAGAIREADDANARRILVSNDGHVIDGHHQWLDRLENAPDHPMPALRIDAPARDILRQIHEFPSAGMEKAPDIGERIIAPPETGGDTPQVSAAREWLADERHAGRYPSAPEMARAQTIPLATARQLMMDQSAAEHRAGKPVPAAPPKVDVPSRPPVEPPVTPPAKPINAVKAVTIARRIVGANRAMLADMGVRDVKYTRTNAPSGVEIRDGTLHIEASKVAESLNAVRELQAKKGIPGTPEDWLSRLIVHEGIHAADFAVAEAKGQTIQERYESLPTESLPEGWQKTGRQAYGPEWDALPEWKQKAEFVRQVVEGRWTGTITESVYKFIREALDHLRSLAGFDKTDPRFKAHVEEVESRLETARRANPTGPKAPRTFSMPHAPTGAADVLDHIAENGGIVSPKDARAKPTYDPRQGDYDGAPDLRGIYHHAVYGGRMMPDRMAQLLHENHGIGDGSVDGMWNAISQAKDLRRKVRAVQAAHAVAEKQANRFTRDTAAPKKGAREISTSNLNVGDHVKIGDQTLKVTHIDEDTFDVTLEDHSKYGVQKVVDGQALFVEKVTPASGESLAAARPDTQTRRLFGDDEPFDLRGEAGSDTERIALARALVKSDASPTLRAGEKGTGDLFQGNDQPFNLAGETGIDHGARQAAAEQVERDSVGARAKQDREQQTLFAAKPDDESERGPLYNRPVKVATVRGDEIAGKNFAELRSRAIAYAQRNGITNHSFPNDDTGIEVRVMPSTLLHGFSNRGAEQMLAVPALPEIIKNAVRTDTRPHEPASPEISGVHTFFSAVHIGDQLHRVKLTVKEHVQEGRKLYDYQAIKIERPDGNSQPAQSITEPLARQPASSLSTVKLGDLLADVNEKDRRYLPASLRGEGESLGAAKPGDEDEPAPVGALDRAKAALNNARDRYRANDTIKKHFDAIDTKAGRTGTQEGNSVRLDYRDDLDRQAAAAVVEAGGQRPQLEADLAKVKASVDSGLAAKYAPVYQHALDHLDRLHAASDNYNRIEADQLSKTARAGIPIEQRDRYVAHAFSPLERADGGSTPLAGSIGAGDGHGEPTLADMIAAGHDPGTMDLGDLTERRVQRNQRLINERAFHDELSCMRTTDGKPVLSAISENESKKGPGGDIVGTLKVPPGYKAVQARDKVLTVHKDFAPVIQALYGDSALRQHPVGNALLNLAAIAKHGTVGVLDTFHGSRVIARGTLGFQTTGWDRGLAANDYAPRDLERAVEAGRITRAQADYVKANGEAVERGLREGLNVGRFSDNLLEASRQHGLIEKIPVVGKASAAVTDYTFRHVQRGVMTQAYVVAEARNRARFPELSETEVARKSATEVNEFFGNLGSQGFLTSKTMQDAARIVLMAPGFAEGMLRTEGRGIAQALKIPVDALRGKGIRVGSVAQALGSVVLASVIGNQMLNLFTRGRPTWENDEDGHKWDAWIPGGPHGRGFFYSPLSMAAEYSHAMLKYTDGGENGFDAAAHIASNKLSGPARAVKDLAGGKDWRGQPFATTGERVKAAAADALPLPIPAGPFIERDPKSPLGFGLNHDKGAGEKQLLAGVGLKVDAAQSARSRMYGIARQFKPAGGAPEQAQHQASAYGELRHALDNEDGTGAAAEVTRLVTQGGKSLEQVGKALGIGTDGRVSPELFTGKADTESRMIAQLTPEQRKLWVKAQKDHQANARLFAKVVSGMTPEQRRTLALASVANRRGNKGLANTLGNAPESAKV